MRIPPAFMHSSEHLAALQHRAAEAAAATTGVLSPCLSICRLTDDRSLCVGCFRTLDEIRDWSRATDAEKRAVWQRLLQRAAAV